MPTLRTKTKIKMTRTVVRLFHTVDYSRDSILQIPQFQTIITPQFHGDYLFF